MEADTNVNIISRDSQPYARIHHRGPYNEIGECFQRLLTWATSQGLLSEETRYFSLSWDDPTAVPVQELRSAACITIEDAGITPPDDIEIATLPSLRWAVYTLAGPYEGITDAYQRISDTWLPQQGEAVADHPCMERYLNDVGTTPPDQLRTELCIPLADRANSG